MIGCQVVIATATMTSSLSTKAVNETQLADPVPTEFFEDL